LYGTTASGGSAGRGTVFKVNTDGNDFAVLHNFAAPDSYNSFGEPINEDGVGPAGRLVLFANVLYGTASGGGSWGGGTVFALNPDGTGFTNPHSFTRTSSYTNSDGTTPVAGLTVSGNTLCGTTRSGGSAANGTVFGISLPINLPP